MMKSLYISYDGVLEPLGQSQIISYLQELSNKGINFILLSYEKRKYIKNKELLNRVSETLKNYNIRWVRLQYHKNPPIISTIYDMGIGIIVAIYIIGSNRKMIVHARAYVPAFIGLVLKKCLKAKFIFDMRGLWADERVDAGLWRKERFLYYITKLLERLYLKSADAVIVLAKRTSDYIKDIVEISVPLALIPCVTDTKNFSFDFKTRQILRKEFNFEDKFIFIHTGSLEGWYLIEEMLDFFKIAKETINNAHFLILTHSPKEKIISIISKKSLSLENFTIKAILYTEMPKYLSVADAGLFFLKSSFSMRHASPVKVAEYLSCGLPVVTNRNIGDIEEYILQEHTGVIINDFNENEYKKASEKILSLSRQDNIRAECRKRATLKLSLEDAIKRYYEIYSKLG